MANEIDKVVKSSIEELSTIAEQVRANADASAESRAAGKLFDKANLYIGDKREELEALDDIDGNMLDAAQELLGSLAEALNPKKAEVLWKREDVQAKLDALIGMSKAGMLTDDQKAIVESIATDLGSKARGPRTQAEKIKGRPAKVVVTILETHKEDDSIPEGEERVKTASTLTGDTKQSGDNLAMSLFRIFFGKDHTAEDRNTEEGKAIRALARKAIESGEVQRIANVTITPSAPAEEGDED